MYLDLDLHFSDAVSQAFYSTRPTGNIQVLVRMSLSLVEVLDSDDYTDFEHPPLRAWVLPTFPTLCVTRPLGR